MTNTEWCAYAYTKGWTDSIKLKIWVSSNKISEEDYKNITGEDYVI